MNLWILDKQINTLLVTHHNENGTLTTYVHKVDLVAKSDHFYTTFKCILPYGREKKKLNEKRSVPMGVKLDEYISFEKLY